jgi:hypothetical protein
MFSSFRSIQFRPFIYILCASSVCSTVRAEDVEAPSIGPVVLVSKSVETPNAEKVLLRYKLKQGEVIKTRVTHLVKTITKIDNEEQPSSCRTVSTKNWKVTGVSADGDMTFEHSVQNVDATQQVGVQDEVRYNSEEETEVPKQFQEVDNKVDQIISVITIRPNGSVVDRSTDDPYARLNLGEIAIQFPQDPVAIGDQWETTREIQVRREDKSPMRVKLRELYTLRKVSAGVAVIDVKNETLTPIRAPEIESQVMQQMNNGHLRFDIDAGRLISKEINWDSKVIGFSGPGSLLEYSARLQEELL